jgi:hypothetical protein
MEDFLNQLLADHPAFSNAIIGIISGVISSILVTLFFLHKENKRLIVQSLYQLHMEISLFRLEIETAIKNLDIKPLEEYVARDTFPTHMKLYGIKLSKNIDEKIKKANVTVVNARKEILDGNTSKVQLIKIKTDLLNTSFSLLRK